MTGQYETRRDDDEGRSISPNFSKHTYCKTLANGFGAAAGLMEDHLVLEVGTDSSLTIESDGLRICGQSNMTPLQIIRAHREWN